MIILSFSKTMHRFIVRSAQSNCCSGKLATSFLLSYGPPTARCRNPLFTRLRQSYSSINKSYESPRLKKQVVKVIWQRRRIAATHGWFNRIRQVAPFDICFLGPPHHRSKLHTDRFSHSCRADDRDRQTNRPNNRPRYSICNNRLHIRT